MKTLRTPNGAFVKVSDEAAKTLLAIGYRVEEPVPTKEPAPKATAKKPSTRTRKTSAKKED